jgi:pimeloyl-ACP methyl ester carboxylesterase
MRKKRIIILIALLIFANFCFPFKGQAGDSNPVILVPGIIASWNWDVMMGEVFGDTWGFFPGVHYYDSLIKALENEGYQVEVAFYDWRQSNAATAFSYLKHKVDEIKQITNSDCVDIIAHSMGGLVARSYIQSDNYEDDVDRLILLGTPNHGSSDAYSPWEGGIIPNNWGKNYKRGVNAYMWYLRHFIDKTGSNYDLIHENILSLGELMPTYDYIQIMDLSGGASTTTYLNMNVQNSFLDDLNNNFNKLRERVYLSNLGGVGKGTVGNIIVEPASPNANTWQDGLPNPFPPPRNNSEGDNRVLEKSVGFYNIVVIPPPWMPQLPVITPGFLEMGNYRTGDFADTEHTAIPHKAIVEILYWLNHPTPDIFSPGPPEMPTAPEITHPLPEEPFEEDNSLNLFFDENVEVKIKAPDGKVISRSTSTIPLAEYEAPPLLEAPKIVHIPNPQEGEYDIEVKGLVDADFDFRIYFADDAQQKEKDFTGDIQYGQTKKYTLALDLGDYQPLQTEGEVTLASLMQDVKNYYANGLIGFVDDCSKTDMFYIKKASGFINNLGLIDMGYLAAGAEKCVQVNSLVEVDDNSYQNLKGLYNLLFKAFQIHED